MLGERTGMRKLALLLAGLAAACTQEPPVTPAAAPPVAAAPSVPTPVLPEGVTAEERRVLLRLGLEAAEAGREEVAIPALERVAARAPTIGDHAFAPLARLEARRGRADAALQRWTELLRRWPDSVFAGEAALALGADRLERGDATEARRWLARAGADELHASVRAAALGLERRLALREGQVLRARSIGETLRESHRGTPEAREAAEAAWLERSTTALVSVEAARAEIERRLAEGDPNRALELTHEARQRFAASPALPELELLRATALGRAGQGEEAVAALEALARSEPRHPAGARALYRLAAGAWNRDDDERALGLFADYRARHPRGENAAQALYATGRIHQEAERWEAAAATFTRLAREHPSSDLAAESAWRVGWCHYRRGDFAGAARAFGDSAKRGQEVPASRYWRARSLERSGGSATATYLELLREHPSSYYAFRAEQRLGRPVGDALRERIGRPVSRPIAPPAANVHWERFEELRAAEILELARLELSAYVNAVGLDRRSSASLIPAWQAVDGWAQAIRVALASGGCEVGARDVHACYPFGYGPLLRAESERRGLDPYLVAALIRQESLYDARARSHADARGLMQLLPSTAARVARTIGSRVPEPEDLYEPAINVPLGASYLAGLLRENGGSPVLALAGYNAGERAVAKWQNRYPGLDEDEFVESISYRETRDYVKRVLQNRRLYGVLYG
jgi:soluble lytic murein transglycosylase